MLILNPQLVRFAGQTWPEVTTVAVDRAAATIVEDRGEAGPYPMFVDVPQQRITVRIVQALREGVFVTPTCGDEGALEVWCAPNASQAGRLKLTMTAVVTAVRYDLARRTGGGGGAPIATRTIDLALYTENGKNDPVIVSDASSGPD